MSAQPSRGRSRLIVVLLVLGLIVSLPGAAADLRQLAGARGCTMCHREAPSPRGPDGVTPLAPSWREIAARYAGRGDAETELTRIVMDGADPAVRHWTHRHDFTSMGANAPRVSPDEARALARWILSSP